MASGVVLDEQVLAFYLAPTQPLLELAADVLSKQHLSTRKSLSNQENALRRPSTESLGLSHLFSQCLSLLFTHVRELLWKSSSNISAVQERRCASKHVAWTFCG